MATEQRANDLDRQIATLTAQVEALRSADVTKQAALEGLSASLRTEHLKTRRLRAFIAALAGVALVFADDRLAATARGQFQQLAQHAVWVQRAIRLIGLLLIALPAAFYIRATIWPFEYKTIALLALFSIAYALVPGVTDGFQTILNDPLVWIAAIVSLLLVRR